jgi:hypothetical protein
MKIITGTLHEELCTSTFMIISCSFLLVMRNVSYKSCREYQTNIIVFNNFFKKNRAVNGIMWKNIVEPDRHVTDGNVTGRMCLLCCIVKATDTYLEYVKLTAFPRQMLLCEGASSTLRFTYMACLVVLPYRI